MKFSIYKLHSYLHVKKLNNNNNNNNKKLNKLKITLPTKNCFLCLMYWTIKNKEGRKEFFLTTHSTLNLWLYGIRHNIMVKNHSDS